MSVINECQFRAASGGTADFVVSSAITGWYTPAQCTNPAVVNGNVYSWRAESDDLTQYELFQGAYTSATATIARTTILQSSNGGAKVNFSSAPRVRQVAAFLDLTDSPSFTTKITLDSDVVLFRDAAGILAQRNGTNAQAFRVYNTFTDINNYERGIFDWQATSNVLTIGTQSAGTGTARRIQFATDYNGNQWTFAGGTGTLRMQLNNIYTSNTGLDLAESGSSKFTLAVYAAGGTNRSCSYYNTQLSADGLFIYGDTNIVSFGTTAATGLGGLISQASGVLELKTLLGTGPTAFRVYGSFTNTSNYERLTVDADNTTASTFRIMSEAAGSGTKRIIGIDAFSKAGAPAAGDLPSGAWGLIDDTSGNQTWLCYNKGGTLRKVQLV